MAHCSKCGEELPEGARFCPRCGSGTKALKKYLKDMEPSFTRGEKVLKSELLSLNEVCLTNRKMLVKKGGHTKH